MHSFAYFLALLGSCLLKEAWAQQEVVFDCAQSLALLNFNHFLSILPEVLNLILLIFFFFLFSSRMYQHVLGDILYFWRQ